MVGSEAWTRARAAEGRPEGSSKRVPPQPTNRYAVRYPRPKAAAVCVNMPRESEMSIKEAMTTVRGRIDPENLGVNIWDTKRTITGGILIEVRGPEKMQQARKLATKIEEVLEGTGTKISIPVKIAEIRLHRVEESVTADEIREAIAKKGGCSAEEVSVGPMRMTHFGLCTVVAKFPLETVGRMSRRGHVMVGWSAARMEILPSKRLRCYRCLEQGHVSATCTGADRSNRCFRCGEGGHPAK